MIAILETLEDIRYFSEGLSDDCKIMVFDSDAKLRLERRKKRRARGITVSIPEGGTGYGKVFKKSWKGETDGGNQS